MCTRRRTSCSLAARPRPAARRRSVRAGDAGGREFVRTRSAHRDQHIRGTPAALRVSPGTTTRTTRSSPAARVRGRYARSADTLRRAARRPSSSLCWYACARRRADAPSPTGAAPAGHDDPATATRPGRAPESAPNPPPRARAPTPRRAAAAAPRAGPATAPLRSHPPARFRADGHRAVGMPQGHGLPRRPAQVRPREDAHHAHAAPLRPRSRLMQLGSFDRDHVPDHAPCRASSASKGANRAAPHTQRTQTRVRCARGGVFREREERAAEPDADRLEDEERPGMAPRGRECPARTGSSPGPPCDRNNRVNHASSRFSATIVSTMSSRRGRCTSTKAPSRSSARRTVRRRPPRTA